MLSSCRESSILIGATPAPSLRDLGREDSKDREAKGARDSAVREDNKEVKGSVDKEVRDTEEDSKEARGTEVKAVMVKDRAVLAREVSKVVKADMVVVKADTVVAKGREALDRDKVMGQEGRSTLKETPTRVPLLAMKTPIRVEAMEGATSMWGPTS